jgi:hypothetical protein
MLVTIDRFEGEFAVVECPDRRMANLPKILVPDAKEGDVISIELCEDETNKRKREISGLMDDLFK